MAGYRRVISYIYEYEQDERKEQFGCVKLHVREREWRIDLWLRDVRRQDLEITDETYAVYVYVLEGDHPAGICLGRLKEDCGFYTWKETLNEDFWIQEKLEPERIRGICICRDSKVRYACEWDDVPIEVQWFRRYQDTTQQEDDVEDKKETEIQDCELRGMEAQPPVVTDRRQNGWEYLLQRFPVKTMLQADGRALEYIWLGVKDLQKLPRNCWILGNNSFVLHGYYQYGHLLLCRMDGEQQTEYYLAVPGICNEKESMMAGLFGFGNFHKTEVWGNRRSEYGYWFRKIEDASYDYR